MSIFWERIAISLSNILIFICLILSDSVFAHVKERSLYFITNYCNSRVCRLFLPTLSLIFMSSCVVDIGRHTHSHEWTNTGENRNANQRNEIFPFSLDWTTVPNIWSFRSSYTKTFPIQSTAIFCTLLTEIVLK